MCIFILIYIVVKGIINVTGADNANRKNKKLTFKNNAPLISYPSKRTIYDNNRINIVYH